MQNSSILPAILILTILLWSNEARAVILGQTDDFGTGAQNWANGHGAGSVALGGPAGASDQFLNVVADGSQANGRLTIFNRNQWLGSYITAGVTEIDMDLKDFGTVPATLSIRLVFKQSTAGMNTPGYLSTTPFTLSNDGQWHHATFQISAAAMTALFGPTPFTTLMSAPAEFRIINEVGATNLDGDFVTSELGIDNIHALPEPCAGMLLLCAGAALISRRPSRHTKRTGITASLTGRVGSRGIGRVLRYFVGLISSSL